MCVPLKRLFPEDIEEIVQMELDAFKTTMEMEEEEIEENESKTDPYGPPEGCSGFYWSGEDSCEIHFYD